MSMRMRFVALGVATLLLIGAWFMVAFKPAQSKISEVRAEVKTTQEEVAALTQRLAHLKELQKDEKNLRAKAEKFDKALPTKAAVSDFIRSLQKAADEAGIDFITITPTLPTAAAVAAAPAAPAAPAPSAAPSTEAEANVQPTAPVSPLQSVAVSLTAKGKFFAIENFVSKLEKLERAIRIDDFNLSGGGGDSASAENADEGLSLSLKLQMFLNKPAAAPAAPSAAASTSGATSGS